MKEDPCGVRWRRAFEGKRLKVNIGKTKVMQKQVMGRVLGGSMRCA